LAFIICIHNNYFSRIGCSGGYLGRRGTR
jgi:hypothetical protein